jgi:hypothetical protein
VLRASNPYPVPATVFFEFHQPSPLFRTYLQHRWLHLQPGEERQLLVMTETVLGDPKLEKLVREHLNRDQRLSTHLRLSALGHSGEACAPEVLGGATILVLGGREARFERFEAVPWLAHGRVVMVDDKSPALGKVLVTVRPADPQSGMQERSVQTQLSNGEFRVELPPQDERVIVQGHYLGQLLLAPCDSKELAL